MKYRVWNKSRCAVVGIKTRNNQEFLIYRNSFIDLDEDDILYLNSWCTLFKRGYLTIENPSDELLMKMGIKKDSSIFLTDEQIRALLSGKLTSKKKEEIEKITEPEIKYKVMEIARSMELTMPWIKFLEEWSGIEYRYKDEEIGEEVD